MSCTPTTTIEFTLALISLPIAQSWSLYASNESGGPFELNTIADSIQIKGVETQLILLHKTNN